MPVDFFVILIPLIAIISLVVAVAARRLRKIATIVAVSSVVLFVFIYFVPGWLLMIRAHRGDAAAEYDLGVWYWTRCGYMWSDVEARDKWWLRAAKAGHPHAMYQVGYFYQYGSSPALPVDLVKARYWIEAAAKAGDYDASQLLKTLEADAKKN